MKGNVMKRLADGQLFWVVAPHNEAAGTPPGWVLVNDKENLKETVADTELRNTDRWEHISFKNPD